MRRAMIFTRDCQLYSALQRFLCETDLNVKFFDQHKPALEALQEHNMSFLFLDARPGEIHGETISFVNDLVAGAVPKLNVITIGQASFPRSMAAELHLLSTAHLIFQDDLSLLPVENSENREFSSVLGAKEIADIPQVRILSGGPFTLTTREPRFFQVLEDLKRVAHRDVTLLIVGETGTGKTTLARIIHERSQRKDAPFQQLACGALPSDIIESELFGHVRGAFTGAERNKIGRFQAAGKGTLLLDEIDVLDVKQQAKLLKVIETGEYEMVGSTESLMSEARLITASNLNLEDLTCSNSFRSDLYYRLSVLEFRLFPLRERVVDIAPMAVSFINECCAEHGVEIEAIELAFFAAIRKYPWPGNIRELKNHVRRAVLFSEHGLLKAADLSTKITEFSASFAADTVELDPQKTLSRQVEDNERELLLQALHANFNNRTQTAKALGISRVGLYKKLRRLGLLDEMGHSGIKRAS